MHKEATEYEIPKDDSTTDNRAEAQLALQICHSLVIIDKDQLGSPEKTKNQEPWAPDNTPILAPATYTPQQKQPRLQMSTMTITRTLAEGSTQHTPTQQLPVDQSGRGGGRQPPGPPDGNTPEEQD